MEPGQGSAVDAEPRRETVEEDGMVNGVKSSRKVKEAKASDLLFADVLAPRSCFSRRYAILKMYKSSWQQ